MVVTLDVSQLETSPLKTDKNPNALRIDVTLLTSHAPISWAKVAAVLQCDENRSNKLVTAEMSQNSMAPYVSFAATGSEH
jgi:hypothetical protein